ncbi:AAA family ATPase [Bacillus sp. P14.5]|uniref:phosphotransferase-like protein n=1 Tax=Bacillus sp. P14.5 TaxID=1983400 RepID=UPI0013B069EF|nr:AAA family ATPase [Bacillus sp. P14.5]
MSKGKIILLNGVSSSGKSTVAGAIVKKLPNYFHLSIDDYDYIIEKMEDRDNQRLIPVPTEYFFHKTVAMFSDKGVNLVVDQILFNEETHEDCYRTLNNPIALRMNWKEGKRPGETGRLGRLAVN